MKTLDKIFNLYTLIVLNVGIIWAAELIGGGKYFHDSGIIHGIALLFIILAAVANIFYDISSVLNIDQYQIVYLNHFTFYAALSAMYLAFPKLTGMSGVHKDLKEQEGVGTR